MGQHVNVWRLQGLVKTFTEGLWPFRRSGTALRGASLSVDLGERVGVVGPSGSGKSTLMKCGLGLTPYDAGRVALWGEDTKQWSASRWRRARNQVQLLVQDPRAMLHPDVPIGTWLTESASLHRAADRSRSPRARADQALGDVGLAGRQDALPRELSGGEQRRVGLARVLLAQPRLLVADEPTTGLDASVRQRMLDLLFDRIEHECAVVMVSHDLRTVLQRCTRVVVIDNGQVVEQFDTTGAAPIRPSHPCTAALLEAAGYSPSPAEGPS